MYPVLLEFGFITIFSLWLFIAIGFVAGSFVFVSLAKRYRIKFNLLSTNSIFLFAVALISARICFIIFNPDLYFYNFSFSSILKLFALWDKGLSFWGAILGFCVALWWLSKKHNESLVKIWDLIVPALLVGILFGDVGALLDGINYGSPTDLPWGVTFRSANVKYISPVHPTQIYAMIYTTGILAILFILIRNTRLRFPGLIAHVGITLFSFFRFLEELIRGDETIEIFSVRAPLIIFLLIFLTSFYLFYIRYIGPKANWQIPGGIWRFFRWHGNQEE